MHRYEPKIEIDTLSTEEIMSKECLDNARAGMAERALSSSAFAIDNSLTSPAVPPIISKEDSDKLTASITSLVRERSKLYRDE